MKYFKLSEFEKNNAKVTDTTIKYNIETLGSELLDKIREFYGKPIYVIEGYNPSSSHKGHTIGTAVDITTKSKEGNKKIFDYIKTLIFDEAYVNGDYDSIHVSYYPTNKKQVIEQTISTDGFMSDYIVCLDSGHGSNTPGKRSPDSKLLEYAYTREIKYRLAEELEKEKIVLCFDVNPEDEEPGLTTRANRVNEVYKKHGGKTIYISIHVNAAGNGQWMNARGWSIWTTKGKTESDNLAETIYKEAEKVLTPQGIQMRYDMSDGDRDFESNFTVICKAVCPCCLVENLFQDNKEDVEYLLSEKGKSSIVLLLKNGIKEYLKTKM